MIHLFLTEQLGQLLEINVTIGPNSNLIRQNSYFCQPV